MRVTRRLATGSAAVPAALVLNFTDGASKGTNAAGTAALPVTQRRVMTGFVSGRMQRSLKTAL
jgi:hypothetical protein